ncbi:SDR family NAD(P)-dependent oxidoreductase [Chloroflexia bacterium SDU3-3]|nr:SDR family NAD(P)-dependent oxidoreductase [Chloroflexia bacterium SDU3-3]
MESKLAGKTTLVTGANSGVGLALTRLLLAEGADVIALIRSEFPADDAAITQAREQGRLRIYRADFADFDALRQALRDIQAHEAKIDILFNNAGVAVPGIEHTPRGHERHFETNAVAPYIIATELRPLLDKGELKTIINTSSNAQLFVRRFDLGLMEHPTTYRPIIGPYGASKLALSLWTQALAPELQAEGIAIRSVCPGPNRTKMSAGKSIPLPLRLLRNMLFVEPEEGARRTLEAAIGPHRGKVGIFIDNGKAKQVRFGQYGEAVLRRMQQIYQREFVAA